MEPVHFQFRMDAFNAFNQAGLAGYNAILNFNAYPNTANGMVTRLPGITSTALGRNANGAFNVTGFGTASQTAPGAGIFAHPADTH
jgi:hypothetical protein